MMRLRIVTAALRSLLVLGLVALSLGGLAGCSLPGATSPTATSLPRPTTASSPTATIAPSAVAVPPVIAPAVPTATVASTATATARPATPATPSARPGTPGTPGTPVATPAGAPQTVQDANLACELALPPGFGPTGVPGGFASADGKVLVVLQSLSAGPDDTLDDLALPFVGAFIPTVAGYEQTAVFRLADSLRIDFRGGLPQPGSGVLYFRQFGPTVCVVTFFVASGAGINVDATFEALIATLRPKGVG